jgi:hypothetical protein
MTQSADPDHGPFLAEVKDAVIPRATLLVIGVGALHLLFIASYVGALHDPKPKDVPFAAVGTGRRKVRSGRFRVDGCPPSIQQFGRDKPPTARTWQGKLIVVEQMHLPGDRAEHSSPVVRSTRTGPMPMVIRDGSPPPR